MDFVIDEEVNALQDVSSHADYLHVLSQECNHESVVTHVDTDIHMKEIIPKLAYTTYTDQEKVRFFKLMFEKVLSVRQLGMHVRSAQYEKDPKRTSTGCPRILNEEHRKVILECIDENPSIVLGPLMERLLQRFKGVNLSLKKARFQPVAALCSSLSSFITFSDSSQAAYI
ncbi:hypothetical protein DFQ30_001055 [Apophysomyces sp. BC1015]|nr:hypothetical protein DFQ30_001055 [Apophysomyces sp. BC1015]